MHSGETHRRKEATRTLALNTNSDIWHSVTMLSGRNTVAMPCNVMRHCLASAQLLPHLEIFCASLPKFTQSTDYISIEVFAHKLITVRDIGNESCSTRKSGNKCPQFKVVHWRLLYSGGYRLLLVFQLVLTAGNTI